MIRKVFWWSSMLLLTVLIGIVALISAGESLLASYAARYLKDTYGLNLSIREPDISLLHGRVSTDLLILSDAKRGTLSIDSLSLDLSMRKLFQGEFVVSELRMTRPDLRYPSELFAHFASAEASPVEQKEPFKLPLIIESGNITGLSVLEAISNGQSLQIKGGVISVSGSTAQMSVTERIESILLIEKTKERNLGTLDSQQTISNENILINRLTLSGGELALQTEKFELLPKLQGHLAASVNLETFLDPNTFSAPLELHASLSGTLDAFRGNYDVSSTGLLRVGGASFNFLKVEGSASKTGQTLSLGINTFDLDGSSGFIRITEPLVLADDSLKGTLVLDLDRMSFSNASFEKATGDIRLDGTIKAPLVTASAEIAGLVAGPTSFAPITVQITNDGLSTVRFTANEPINDQGALSLSGAILFEQDTPVLQDTVLRFERKLAAPQASVAGTFSASGPLSLKKLHGELLVTGSLRQGSRDLPIEMTAQLSEAKLLVRANQESILQLQGEIDLEDSPSNVTLTLSQPDLAAWYPPAECGVMHANGTYTFPINNPLAGTGEISLQEVRAGCEKLMLSLSGPPIVIRDGKAILSALQLNTGAGTLSLSGEISQQELSVSAKGNMELTPINSLIPNVLELVGRGDIDIAASGNISDPTFSGVVQFSQVGFFMPEPPIELSEASARIELSGKNVKLTSLTGTVNEGEVNAHGEMQLDNVAETLSGAAKIKSIFFQPLPEVAITLSGDMQLASENFEGTPLPKLSGTIVVDDGIYEKSFDFKLIREKLAALFRRSSGITLTAREDKAATFLLDIGIQGDSSFVVNTNLARAELSPRLRLVGPTNASTLRGIVAIPTGSFTIGKNLFEITNGMIRFSAGESQEPNLTIMAETITQDAEGFPIAVFMEISGPVSDPRVLLSSDNGLGQEEILKLITAGQGFGEQAIFDSALSGLGYDNLSLLNNNAIFGVFSKIDDLAVEPSYSVATGELGSKLVTSERLSDKLKITAEFPFLGLTEQPQVATSYELFPFVSAKVSLKIPQAEAEQSYAADLNWTILSGEPKSPVGFSGNSSIGPVDLTNAIGVSARSRIQAARVPILEKRLIQFYVNRAFLDVSVTTECLKDCEKVHFSIKEGKQYRLTDVAISSTLSAAVPEPRDLLQSSGTVYATGEVRAQIEKEIFDALRKQGFARARVKYRFEKSSDDQAVLHVEGTLKDRYEIELHDNEAYSLDTLLKSFRYYEQRFPFGPNFPDDFRRHTEQYYRERGYPEVGVALDIRPIPDGILLYYYMSEGPKPQVQAVRLETSPLSREEFSTILQPSEAKAIFSPEVLNREAAQAGATILQGVLRDTGYPEAQVTLREEPQGDKLRLIYQVSAGAERAYTVTQQGMPMEIPFELPGETLSRVEVGKFGKALQQKVRQAGYFEVAQNAIFNETTSSAIVVITPGKLRTIEEIIVTGNEKISNEVVLKNLMLNEGEAFTWARIAAARRNLYRTGLFQKVDFSYADSPTGADKRIVTVVLREKTLTTLSLTTGYDSEYGVHGGINAVDKSFFADGRELSIRSDLYYDIIERDVGRGFGSVRFRDPQLAEDTSWSEELGFLKTKDSRFQEYDLETVFFRSEIQRAISPKFNLRANHAFELTDISRVPEDIILSDLDKGQLFLSTLGVGAFYTDQDDPIRPRSAKRASIEFRLASETIGSDADFFTVIPKVSGLEPLPFFDNRLSIFAGIQGGLSQPFGATEELPISRRFHLGGQDTLRGYESNSVGPRGYLDNVIGGDRYYAGTAELRYEVIENVTLLTFVDAGRLWLQSLNTDQTKIGAGFGGRYSSPIGALGLDVGFPLDRDEHTDSYEIYFRIGATF